MPGERRNPAPICGRRCSPLTAHMLCMVQISVVATAHHPFRGSGVEGDRGAVETSQLNNIRDINTHTHIHTHSLLLPPATIRFGRVTRAAHVRHANGMFDICARAHLSHHHHGHYRRPIDVDTETEALESGAESVVAITGARVLVCMCDCVHRTTTLPAAHPHCYSYQARDGASGCWAAFERFRKRSKICTHCCASAQNCFSSIMCACECVVFHQHARLMVYQINSAATTVRFQ